MPLSVETAVPSLVPADSKFKIKPVSIKRFQKQTLLNVYRTMVTSRRLDQKMLNLLKQGKGHFHVGASGHEAVQVAAAANMEIGKDWALPYYRDMALALGMGMTARQLLSAHLSRITDTSGGRQMPSHFNSRELRIVAVSSALGANFLPGLGIAKAIQHNKEKEWVYISSGDGGTSQGSFWELLNSVNRIKAPAVILVQDNKFAISVPVSEQTSNGSISKCVVGFTNFEILEVDGTDFFHSYAAFERAAYRARSGQGPTFIHAHVVRLLPHSSSDDDRKYRTESELAEDKKHDPIPRFEEQLISAGIASEFELETLKMEVRKQIDADTEWVLQQPEPKPETATDYVFSHKELGLEYEKPGHMGDPVVMVDAINHAMAEEMERDEKVIVFGEDVAGGKGGVFTATRGLTERFGDLRCFNTPLAEATIAGMACGMSIKGFKPVIEIQFGDYIWPAMQMLRNQIPSLRYRSHNQYGAPMVIRVPVGGYIHGGLCHSQNIESIFGHIPGFKIVMPSNAADAKGLLKTAIRSDDPVMFLEHKYLYRQGFARSPEPHAEYLVEIGKAKVVCQGTDLTIVSYGALLHKAVQVAREMKEKTGAEIEVIDVRTIVPLDSETILNSVKKTGRVLVLHEDIEFIGFGAEIAAQIAQFCFEYLDAPVQRVAGKFSWIAYAPPLEDALLPQKEDIDRAVNFLLKY